jgi:hypothetical protein
MTKKKERDGWAVAYLKYVADNEQAKEGKVLRTDLHATWWARKDTEGQTKGSLVGKAGHGHVMTQSGNKTVQWCKSAPSGQRTGASAHCPDIPL